MFSIEKCPVPADTMLEKYLKEGAYTNCYATQISGQVSFSTFIVAFYTTPLFKLERLILKLTVSKPSTDLQARQLADRTGQEFAAWHVESRGENEILMCDFRRRTRSWLMTVPVNTMDVAQTRLYFGSAIVPTKNSKTGDLSIGFGFKHYWDFIGSTRSYSCILPDQISITDVQERFDRNLGYNPSKRRFSKVLP
jgi:hypothetical protein